MITVTEAFRKFRSRLELTQKEQDDASRRQREIRSVMDEAFKLQEDFLSGSYKRHTKTKPLKDVDIFCVLHEDERPKFRNGKHPSVLLNETERVLKKHYDKVKQQHRSISIEFPVSGDPERVLSFDVVPGFTKGDHYEIPDTGKPGGGWTETNPRVHAEKATKANADFDGEWKGMVRMIKRWNQEAGKPVKPSFLLEVMCLDLLKPKFNGEYPYEFMGLFSSAADRILERWEEPAKLGPPVSNGMTTAKKEKAQKVLREASYAVRDAINLSRSGSNGEALKVYRKLFGELFPLS